MEWKQSTQAYLRTLTPATAKRYAAALDDFAAWYAHTYGEPPDPTFLTDEEGREWRGHLTGVRKLAASTVNVRLSALKGLARFSGASLDVRGVRQVRQPVEPLTGRELGRLTAAVRAHDWGPAWLAARNVALVAVLARAGLRVGEAVALDTADVEINARSGWALVRQGKGLKQRRVPLSRQVRKSLEAYLAVRPAWVGGNGNGQPLFVTKSGQRMAARSVQRMVEGAAGRAGLTKRVTPHVLRHSFSTRFLQKGGDLATLRAVLGHANVATTSRYLHPNAAEMQGMVEEL